MKKRKRPAATFPQLARLVADRLKPPTGLVLGSPAEAAELVASLSLADALCYQMDLYQAERLTQELAQRGVAARVVTAADLWDLGPLQSLLYPVPRAGERALKLDLVEQAYHTLAPGGVLAVLSPHEKDQLFPDVMKKVFGRVHFPEGGGGAALWSRREGDRPRRRHEMTFHVSRPGEESLRFVTRPGVFAYGRFDEGGRALVEVAEVHPGDAILDMGCGCGTNGVHTGLRAQPGGRVTFVDSNVRAVALAELNARANGLEAFATVASANIGGVADGAFDVALANPPYYAQGSIAQLFIERAAAVLKPGGRFYLVTKQAESVGPMVDAAFPDAEALLHRGYVVFRATNGPPPDGIATE